MAVPIMSAMRSLKRLGYFVTESSEHFAEYTPWFIKNHQPGLLKDFNIPINEYIRRCEKQIQEWDDQEQQLLSNKELVCEKSVEYASRIILSMVTGKEDLIYGNVLNTNLIPNLPANSCVEVPCLVRKNESSSSIGGDPSNAFSKSHSDKYQCSTINS